MFYSTLVAKYPLNGLAAILGTPPEKNPNIFNPDYKPVCFQVSPEQQKLRDLVRRVAREPGPPEPKKSWYDSLRGDWSAGTRRAKCKEQLQKLFLPPTPDSPSALEILRSHFNEVLTLWGFAKSSPGSEPGSPVKLVPEILSQTEPELNLKTEPECDPDIIENHEKAKDFLVNNVEEQDTKNVSVSPELVEISVPITEIVDQKTGFSPVAKKRAKKGNLLVNPTAVPDFEDDFWFSGPSTFPEARENVEPNIDLELGEISNVGGDGLHSVWDWRLENDIEPVEPVWVALPQSLTMEDSWKLQLESLEMNASPSLGSFIHVNWENISDDGDYESEGSSRQENVSPWEITSHENISQPNLGRDDVDQTCQSDVPQNSDSGSLFLPQAHAMDLSSSALTSPDSTPETLPEHLPSEVSEEVDERRFIQTFNGQISPRIFRLVFLALFKFHDHFRVPPLSYFIKPHVQPLDLVESPSLTSQLTRFIKLNKSNGFELLTLPRYRNLACFYLVTCAFYHSDPLRAGLLWQHIQALIHSQKRRAKIGFGGLKRGIISQGTPKIVELEDTEDEDRRTYVVSRLPVLVNSEAGFEDGDERLICNSLSSPTFDGAGFAFSPETAAGVPSDGIFRISVRQNAVRSASSGGSDSTSSSLESDIAFSNVPDSKLRLVERNLRRRYNSMPFFDEDEFPTATSEYSTSEHSAPDPISPLTMSSDLNWGIQMLAEYFDLEKFRSNMENLTFESPHSARTDYDDFDFVQCRESYLSAAKLVAIYKDGELRDVAMENFRKYSPVVMRAVADAICDLKQYAGETLTLRLVIAAQEIDDLRQESEALTRMLVKYMDANRSHEERSDSKEGLEDPQFEEIAMRFRIFQVEFLALLDQKQSLEMSQASYLDAFEEYTTEAAELVRHMLQTYRDIFTQEIRFIYNDKSARELHDEFGYFVLMKEHETFIELPSESFKDIYIRVWEKIMTPAVEGLGRTLSEIQGRIYDCGGNI